MLRAIYVAIILDAYDRIKCNAISLSLNYCYVQNLFSEHILTLIMKINQTLIDIATSTKLMDILPQNYYQIK